MLPAPALPSAGPPLRTLIDQLLEEQQTLTPVEAFASWHQRTPALAPHYRRLIPASRPATGEQYAFEVNVSACTGCKACVSACHSLNGLDEEETWRDVGLLLGGTRRAPVQQVVTTACHHCADPACANGCPVLAYEKDAATGIVRHLDDQCIGCQYCILKCPYDVPKYSAKRGIVRKCDMCLHRLAAGEAPACVQACPNEAIRIVTVSHASLWDDTARAPRLVPSAADSRYTRPSTVFTGLHPDPSLQAADAACAAPQPTHWPLVIMLLLTQSGAGVLLAAVVAGDSLTLRVAGAVLLALGIGASTWHLGQPLKAWRAFLGWRKSWLSREILAFGAAVPAAVLAVLAPAAMIPAATAVAAAAAMGSVLCSIMVYADTRRELWSPLLTTVSMLGAVVSVAAATTHWLHPSAFTAALAGALILVRTMAISRFVHAWRETEDPTKAHVKSARLVYGPLHLWWQMRVWGGMAAALLVVGHPGAALAALVIAEMAERVLFFRAVIALKMPGMPSR